MPPPGYRFDLGYREHVRLRDGTEVLLRLVRPEDRDLLREGFQRLSDESRYRRFFTFKPRLSNAELTYLTELDQRTHFAIGALRTRDDGSAEGIAVARFVCLQGQPDTAEAAIAVADDVQGKGLGGLLLPRLVAAARERSVRRFRFEVLGDNLPMQHLIRDLGARTELRHERGVSIAEWDLSAQGACRRDAKEWARHRFTFARSCRRRRTCCRVRASRRTMFVEPENDLDAPGAGGL